MQQFQVKEDSYIYSTRRQNMKQCATTHKLYQTMSDTEDFK